MADEIRIWVAGKPQPGGSKKAFYIKKISRTVVVDANPKAKDWKAMVAQAADGVVPELLAGPLRVRFDFHMVRPAGHFKKSGALKVDAPAFPTTRPDCVKLTRSTEDALTGIVWRDDSQIVTEVLTKRYAESFGCLIRIVEEKA